MASPCMDLEETVQMTLDNRVDDERQSTQQRIDAGQSLIISNLTSFQLASHEERNQIRSEQKLNSMIETAASTLATIVFAIVMIAVRRWCSKGRSSEVVVPLESVVCLPNQPQSPEEIRKEYR